MAKFFGCDGIDPEFQYAADIVNNRAPPSYQQNIEKTYAPAPIRNDRPPYVSTAKRIFN